MFVFVKYYIISVYIDDAGKIKWLDKRIRCRKENKYICFVRVLYKKKKKKPMTLGGSGRRTVKSGGR